MSYILSIDQGTTSSRALIVNKNGEIISISQKEHKQIYPKASYVEHNPSEIWDNVNIVCDEAVKKIGGWEKIKAIGITNQRETVIAWDKISQKNLHNAIVWQCRRSSDIIDKLKEEGYSEMIIKKTGLVPDAYFSGSKMKWLLENSDKVKMSLKNKSLMFGTMDSYLVYKMTNSHITDITNASRTMLYNISNKQWDSDLLEMLKIPEWCLPVEVYPSSWNSELYWEKDGNKIPISGIAGDQMAALFGQLAFEPGSTKVTYGTGNFSLENIGNKPIIDGKTGLLTTIAWSLDELKNITYAIEGAVFITGALIQWLRDGLNIISNVSEIEEMAIKAKDEMEDLVIVPAFSGLGAPYWNQNARGTILGITGGTNKNHIAKAALESIVFQTYDILEAMGKLSPMTEIKVDGGASKNNYLMQLQADVLQKTIIRPKNIETTALGAAFLSGLGKGFWENINEIKLLNPPEKTFFPDESYNSSKKIDKWKKAVKRSFDWV